MTLYMEYQRHHRNGLEEGLREGQMQATLQNLRHLMSSLSLSPEQAVDALQIPQEERTQYLQQL